MFNNESGVFFIIFILVIVVVGVFVKFVLVIVVDLISFDVDGCSQSYIFSGFGKVVGVVQVG